MTDLNNFEIRLTKNEAELQEVYKLRYEDLLLCFNKEKVNESGIFTDIYDPVSDHIIAIDLSNNEIAGTYRLARKTSIAKIGAFITESEFDISKIKDYEILELGRAVVKKKYRNGAVLSLLWQGIVNYVVNYNIRFLFGTASFHGVNLENYKHALSQIYYHHLTPSKFRVQAINHPLELKQLNLEDLDQEIARIEMPALIRGYIKLGATFGNGAYIDFDFNSIDVFTLIDMETINRRYLDKFMKSL